MYFAVSFITYSDIVNSYEEMHQLQPKIRSPFAQSYGTKLETNALALHAHKDVMPVQVHILHAVLANISTQSKPKK